MYVKLPLVRVSVSNYRNMTNCAVDKGVSIFSWLWQSIERDYWNEEYIFSRIQRLSSESITVTNNSSQSPRSRPFANLVQTLRKLLPRKSSYVSRERFPASASYQRVYRADRYPRCRLREKYKIACDARPESLDCKNGVEGQNGAATRK